MEATRVGYVGELFALEEGESEFNTRTQVRMLDMEAGIYNPSAGEAETGRALSLK